VREVLGLASDELYAEALALAAERRPAAVFPLVDRLVNAGLDLAEFMGGAGEALRALLMLQLGSEPGGLTEVMREALRRYREALAPGDALRMLKLLAESETTIRRGASTRLVVETLLLRWAMLDRIVDLQQVIEGGQADGRTGGQAGRRTGAQADSEGATPVSASTAPEVEEPLSGRPPVRPSALVEFSLDGLRGAWPEIVAAVRERRPFLGEAVATTEPAEVAPPWVTIRVSGSSALFVQPLQEHTAVVEEIIGQAVGSPVRLRVTAGSGGPAAPESPTRMSEASIRADRLKHLRAKDPALDTAADALDLEIVE
jgi:DNA polymerase-3 subunit gamma/tau